MSEKIEMLKTFAQDGFLRLSVTLADTWSLDPSDHDHNLTEEQLDWKSCPEANSIRWNLTHIINSWSLFVPRVIMGDKEYKPDGWPDDYVGNKSYSLAKIMGDLEEGKAKLMKKLDSLTDEVLAEEMDWFFGKQTKEWYIRACAISELHWHGGQIAAIRAIEKRMRG